MFQVHINDLVPLSLQKHEIFYLPLAKYYDAEFTSVCSVNNFNIVKSIGAGKVIDYTKEDFTKIDEKYDIVYDAVIKSKKADSKRILKENC